MICLYAERGFELVPIVPKCHSGTNLRKMGKKDIIIFYNARGESEKNFDIQNNDFGWAHLPFSFLGENMVFMLVTAMLKNFYLYLLLNLHLKTLM